MSKRAILSKIKNFWVGTDEKEAKQYIGLVFYQAFQYHKAPFLLKDIEFIDDEGDSCVSIVTSFGEFTSIDEGLKKAYRNIRRSEYRRLKKALHNAFGRLVRQGSQYPISYTTFDDTLIFLPNPADRELEEKKINKLEEKFSKSL